MARTEIIRQSKIGSTIKILQDGGMEAEEDVIIEGDVTLSKIDVKTCTLRVCKGSNVEADIFGDTIIIQGNVTGNITASTLIQIENPGSVHGEMTTPHFKMDADTVFTGRIIYT